MRAFNCHWRWFTLSLFTTIYMTCTSATQTNGHQNDTYSITLNGVMPAYEWLWLNGNNVGNQHDITTSSKGHNLFMYPGARAGASHWMDSSGIVWVFGGKGYDINPTNDARLLGELWMFNSKDRRWSHISKVGDTAPKPRWKASMCGVTDILLVITGGEAEDGQAIRDTWVYDMPNKVWIQVHPTNDSSKSHPSARHSANTWCAGDHLMMFGGLGQNNGVLSDMWEFSLQNLVWENMQQYSHSTEVTGSSLFPAGRYGAVTWVGANHALYMYGGSARTDTHTKAFINQDMWEYDRNSSTWHAHYSSPLTQQPPFYSSIGVASKLTSPGSRRYSASWLTHETKYLWLFGGEGAAKREDVALQQNKDFTIHSDLWRYDLGTKLWMWLGGSKDIGLSMYGIKSVESPNNFPGARFETAAWCYKNLTYIFGGYGFDARNLSTYLNDLWVLIPDDSTYLFQRELTWFQKMPPMTVFLISLGSVGGVALAFGTAFFIKKMIDYPKNRPSKAYNVKYSRIAEEKFELDFDIVMMDEL